MFHNYNDGLIALSFLLTACSVPWFLFLNLLITLKHFISASRVICTTDCFLRYFFFSVYLFLSHSKSVHPSPTEGTTVSRQGGRRQRHENTRIPCMYACRCLSVWRKSRVRWRVVDEAVVYLVIRSIQHIDRGGGLSRCNSYRRSAPRVTGGKWRYDRNRNGLIYCANRKPLQGIVSSRAFMCEVKMCRCHVNQPNHNLSSKGR